MVTRFKGVVGHARIGKTVGPTEAGFTRSVRQQIDAVINRYKDFVDHLILESPEILLGALQPTFDLSQVYVPVQEGILKDSGYLEMATSRARTQVEIGYARGGQPDYAVYVHEHPEMLHTAPTRYKFLEAALEEDFDNVQARIIEGYKVTSGV